MYRTATEQQIELEMCVHDTTLHPSEGEEMEPNEMRFCKHLDTKAAARRWCLCVCPCHRKRVRLSMSPICVTLNIPGLLAGSAAASPLEHQLGMSGMAELGFCLCASFIYSSFVCILSSLRLSTLLSHLP